MAHSITTGTVLTSSWGYDQTNVSFYKVVRTTKTMVVLQPMSTTVASYGKGSDSVVAGSVQADAKEIRRKVKTGWQGDEIVYISDYEIARVWDGQAQYQTAAGYGH